MPQRLISARTQLTTLQISRASRSCHMTLSGLAFSFSSSSRHLRRSIPRIRPPPHGHTTFRPIASAAMATPYRIQVKPADSGILTFPHDHTTATKVSHLLQEDLESHNVFFNRRGYHNHLPHQLLTLYGTGAGPDHLQAAYDSNLSYQLAAQQPSARIVEHLQRDYPNAAPRYLGKGDHYGDFLRFFQLEIEAKGSQKVLLEYLFRDDGDVRAYDLFCRLYASFLHPLIQLMFAMEWDQPAILAEALAQTAVHENDLGEFFTRAERRAGSTKAPRRPFSDVFHDVESDPRYAKLRNSSYWSDGNVVFGLLGRAFDQALELASTISVAGADLNEVSAEMTHTIAYITSIAAWNPPHIPKFDFFLIHHLNAAPIFHTINKQTWIPTSTKIRLLEWKMRLDVLEYIGRGSPRLHGDILKTYTPQSDLSNIHKPQDLLPLFHQLPDDGHIIKVARALLVSEEATRPYKDKPWVRIHHDREWLMAHCMLLDSVEDNGTQPWVRGAGFQQSWSSVPEVGAKL